MPLQEGMDAFRYRRFIPERHETPVSKETPFLYTPYFNKKNGILL